MQDLPLHPHLLLLSHSPLFALYELHIYICFKSSAGVSPPGYTNTFSLKSCEFHVRLNYYSIEKL